MFCDFVSAGMYHSAPICETPRSGLRIADLLIPRILLLFCRLLSERSHSCQSASRNQKILYPRSYCVTIRDVMKILASRFRAHPRQVCFWLTVCAAAGMAMLFLFDDSCQQDGGQHYLFARWAWVHHELFVGVWSRPLYTSIYAFPALIGYRAARMLTVLICLAVSYQTWRLAEVLKIDRAPLAIALVWLQPSFFLFCADNMTEPIFALVYVVALRLHHRNWIKAGMIVASLAILARPEGLFLSGLWALWVLFVVPPSGGMGLISNLFRLKARLQPGLLATGAFIWWLAALILTGDSLFIKHNWPTNWPMTGTIYGAAGLYAYPIRLPEILGLFLLPVFAYGLIYLFRQR